MILRLFLISTVYISVVNSLKLWTPNNPPAFNWTQDYDRNLAEFALEFASAAYSPDPTPCLLKNKAKLIKRVELSCDYVHDECWAYIAVTDQWIIMAVRGTKTKLQLITELVETMSAPKKQFPGGGSVQRYFFYNINILLFFIAALQSLWHAGFGHLIRQLKEECQDCKILFTGHSLGGALVSLASSLFAHQHRHLVKPSEIFLITFGQPRVGNQDYAVAHDSLVPNSWRLVHRYDIVSHLPYCYESIFSRQCSVAYNHGPWHHGTEIWYPEEMENNSSLFRICTSMPINEDKSCSNGYYIHYRISDHLTYLGKDVSGYGNAGCRVSDKTKRLKTNKTRNKNLLVF